MLTPKSLVSLVSQGGKRSIPTPTENQRISYQHRCRDQVPPPTHEQILAAVEDYLQGGGIITVQPSPLKSVSDELDLQLREDILCFITPSRPPFVSSIAESEDIKLTLDSEWIKTSYVDDAEQMNSSLLSRLAL